MSVIDIKGETFGKLTVVRRVENRFGKAHWMCKCECGKPSIVQGSHLRSGHTTSCGCASPFKRTHGGTYERLYSVWCAMKRRCYGIRTINYPNYGGRGIRVCDEWRNDYAAFRKWALKNGYEKGLELDRIDVDGNYEPDNCRWVTRQKQSYNKRSNRVIEYKGKSKTMAEWAEEIGISIQTLSSRLNKLGWSVERALTTPPRGKVSGWTSESSRIREKTI